MNVSGQVLNLVKYQVSHCLKTSSLCWAEWHWIYGSYFSVLKNYHMLLGGRRVPESKRCIDSALMFSFTALPAATTSTHLCTHVEVSSERNLIMDEQLLSCVLLCQPNTWPRGFEFGWRQASL